MKPIPGSPPSKPAKARPGCPKSRMGEKPGRVNRNNNLPGQTFLNKTVITAGVQSLPTGIPDDRLKLRVTIDSKFKESIRRSQCVSVPSSPTCSSPDGCGDGDHDSLYDNSAYSKHSRSGFTTFSNPTEFRARVPDWQRDYHGYQLPDYQVRNNQFQQNVRIHQQSIGPYQQRFFRQNNPYCAVTQLEVKAEPVRTYSNSTSYPSSTSSSYLSPISSSLSSSCLLENRPRIIVVKNEPEEVKTEPADPYSLADLDNITDLLPIPTDFRMDVTNLNDLDWWETGNGRTVERWENGKMVVEKIQENGNVKMAEKWESSSSSSLISSSSNSSHFDFSSNTDEVFSQIGIKAFKDAEFTTL